jgi:hypothetical protein
MGLDIHLDTIERHRLSDRHEVESEALYQRQTAGEITEAEYDELCKTVTPWPGHEDVPSEKYPKHLMNRRYLRSSYNDGGFNRRVPDLIGDEQADLYGIFKPLHDVIGDPDGADPVLTDAHISLLEQCRTRAASVAERLHGSDRLAVMKVSPNQFSREWLNIDSDKALSLYRDAVRSERIRSNEGWWSNRDMKVFGEGVTILAAVAGVEKRFFSDDPWPAVHLIYRLTDEGFESYVQSAEIVVEFIDEAISLIRRDGSCSMRWSG